MASRWEEPPALQRKECDNCGATAGLLRCSRCRASWFCSLTCFKAYWPFHRAACRPNEFADAMEPHDERFAAWMRGHGKLAVLKDREVDRLERAGGPGGWQGLGREEVLAGMYGRAHPEPRAPSFTPAEASAMAAARQQEQQAAQQAVSAQERMWATLLPDPAAEYGVDCMTYKWRQNQTHVEVWVRLPASIATRQVAVTLTPTRLEVAAAGDVLLRGALAADVKAEDSTWHIDGEARVLHVHLLKRCRRGHYADGMTNADTWWRSLLKGAGAHQRLPDGPPPTSYYSSLCEAEV